MRHILNSFVLLLCIYCVKAQMPFGGPCPDIQPITPMDDIRYSGLWFEQAKYLFLPEIKGSCISVSYTPVSEGFDTVIRFKDSWSKHQLAYSGKTLHLDTVSTGNLQLQLNVLNPLLPQVEFSKTVRYQLIDTDYTTYAIKWACLNYKAVHFRTVWILTRAQDYTTVAGLKDKIYQRLAEFKIDSSFLKETDQNNCKNTESSPFLG